MGSTLPLLLVVVLALSVLLSIRVCRESERVALNTAQRFVKLIGPGLFLKFPMQVSPYEYTRVRIGDSGRYIGNGWARLGGQRMPVRAAQDLGVDENLRVEDFVGQEIFVEPQAEDESA